MGAFEELGFEHARAAAASVIGRQLAASRRRSFQALSVVAPMRRGQVLALLRFVDSTLVKERWAPSRRELAGALGISASTVARVVEVAEEAGFVERVPRGQRAIRTTKKARAMLAKGRA